MATPLTRNKQIALCALLATRSAYRAMVEGVPVIGSNAPPNPVQSVAHLLQRFQEVPPPTGITATDIANLTDPTGPLGWLYDPSATISGNITTDPAKIAIALGIQYVPTDPDCPCFMEGNTISNLLATNLGTTKPGAARPPLKYGPPPHALKTDY